LVSSFSWSESPLGAFWPFTEEWLPSGQSTIKADLLECCRDGCPFGSFSHLHKGTLELCQWQSGSWSPPWPRPFSPDCSGWPGNFFHLWMMEDTVILGSFNAADIFWYPSPDLCLDLILSGSSTDNFFDLIAWFLLWLALSTVGPYIDRCVPFPIMSNQLNLPLVDSNQVVETSQWWSMETGCIWAQFRVS
jgi:hypothetical protein